MPASEQTIAQNAINIHGGIRTHDLWIRSPARYPLRYADIYIFKLYSEIW